MFAIYFKTPVYDSRDGFAGSISRQVGGYAYETKALAFAKLPSDYDEEGNEIGGTHYVADTTDPWRRPVAAPVPADRDPYADDINF